MMMDNFEFFIKNDFSEFVGKWVAILDNRSIASGQSFKDVAETVDKKFKGKKAFDCTCS